MARVTIAGDAVVITSALALEDIKAIEKYRPEELIIKGGEDGKEPVFKLGTTDGPGSIGNYGASFGRESNDGRKLATITMYETGIEGDAREYVADKIGAAVANLNKLEERLPLVLSEIASEKAAVMENITVA